MIDGTQKTINLIHSQDTSLDTILKLLFDERGIVRANALLEIPKREILNLEQVVKPLKEAATNNFAGFRLMGEVTQKKLVIATLYWIGDRAEYLELLNTCDDYEIEDVKTLIQQGPVYLD